jgi:Ca2+-binding RTX toxin-like protein
MSTALMFRIVTASALAGAALGAVSGSPAHAAGETCDGRPATLVISQVPAGFPTVQATEDDDVIVVTTSSFFSLDALGGNDLICNGAATFTDAGPGDDEVWSGSVPGPGPGNELDGDDGNDVLHGTDGREYINGGLGNDMITAGGGNDIIDAADSFPTDTVPTSDDDSIDAGDGDDIVYDTWGDDTLVGGAGRDELLVSNGADDPVDDGCAGPFTARPVLDVATHSVTGLGTDSFDGFEVYTGGAYTATLRGSSGPDELRTAQCGVTTLEGRGGADLLLGESAQRSVISGGPGNDRITLKGRTSVNAGHGNDHIQLDPPFGGMSTHGSHLAGGHGTDWVVVNTPGYDTIDLRSGLSRHGTRLVSAASIENARDLAWPTLHGVSTTLIGDGGRNALIAPHDDRARGVRSILRGLGGNDRLLAGRHDTAYGGSGHDFCRAQHRVECEAH